MQLRVVWHKLRGVSEMLTASIMASFLKTQVVIVSETSDCFYQTIRCNITGNSYLHTRRHWEPEISQILLANTDDISQQNMPSLLHIREVPGSNLGQGTGHPDWGLLWFAHQSTQMPRHYLDSRFYCWIVTNTKLHYTASAKSVFRIQQ
jgi:hypothetical protein